MRWSFVAVALALTAGRVLAQNASGHVTLSGDVAATDNALSTPTNQESDVYFQLRPGVLGTYDSPRQMHELALDVEILEYVRHSDAPSVTERAAWSALFLPSPLTEIVTSASIGTGKLNAITAQTTPDQAPTGLVPTGAVDVHLLNVDEFGVHTLSRSWRLNEVAFVHYTGTADSTLTHTHSGELGAKVGAEYTWLDNSVSLDVGLSYISLERYAPGLPVGPDGSRQDKELNPRLVAGWHHDLSRYWSTNVSGGLQYVQPFGTDKYNPTDQKQSGLYPIFGAQISYSDLWGRLTLAGSRAVAPNLFIAQNTETTGALLQLALPIPIFDTSRRLEPKLVALATAGYEHTQLIDTETGMNETAASFDILHVDVGIAYRPRPGMTYGLRFESLYQTGDATALAVISSFRRNTLFFTFAIRYPDRRAVVVPKRGASVRADRKDQAPVGEELVVPDNPNEADR